MIKLIASDHEDAKEFADFVKKVKLWGFISQFIVIILK